MSTIISPEALRERIGDPKIVIFDCRHALVDFELGARLYAESHLPDAFFASVESDLSGTKTGKNGRHPMPDPGAFASFLERHGVSDDTLVVAYDAGGDMFAPRFWFLCRWLGHDAVAVLDGGIAAWQKRGYPVTAEIPPLPSPGKITVHLHPEMVVDAAHVYKHLDHAAMHLVDARAADRFAGQNETVDPVAGHIPSARNRWFKHNFNDDGTLKTPEQLRNEFLEAGLDSNRTVHQCGSGVSAAVNHWAMTHAGLHGSRIYGGSWSEWIADPSRPIATGKE